MMGTFCKYHDIEHTPKILDDFAKQCERLKINVGQSCPIQLVMEAAEKMQGIAARIQGGADQYLRLRMACVILRREIEIYRAENQGPLLARGGELFNRLTIGSFSGL